jgi:hypothetical protein
MAHGPSPGDPAIAFQGRICRQHRSETVGKICGFQNLALKCSEYSIVNLFVAGACADHSALDYILESQMHLSQHHSDTKTEGQMHPKT